MVLHVKRVPKCMKDKKNPGLRGGSVELCLRGDCLMCTQSSTSIRNAKDYELISMTTSQVQTQERQKK